MKNAKELVNIAFKALDEHQGRDITVLDIREVSVIADYFIIVSGDNERQVSALQDAVEEALYKAGYEHRSVEGGYLLYDLVFRKKIRKVVSRQKYA